MGFATLMRNLSLAMEAAAQVELAKTEIKKYKTPESEGGKEITKNEMLQLVVDLQDNFSTVVTRILQELKIPVKSVNVSIEI